MYNYFVDAIVASRDTLHCDWLWFAQTAPKFTRSKLEDVQTLPRWSLIVWSSTAAEQADKLANLIAEAPVESRSGVLVIDDTPLPEFLRKFPLLEKAKAADVAWQWRVSVAGAPPDHIDRPG